MASGQDEHFPMLWCSFSLCRCSLAWPSRRQKLTAHVGQSGFFVWASPILFLSCMLCSFFPPAVICFQKWREEFAGHWRKYFRNSCEHTYSRIYAMGTVKLHHRILTVSCIGIPEMKMDCMYMCSFVQADLNIVHNCFCLRASLTFFGFRFVKLLLTFCQNLLIQPLPFLRAYSICLAFYSLRCTAGDNMNKAEVSKYLNIEWFSWQFFTQNCCAANTLLYFMLSSVHKTLARFAYDERHKIKVHNSLFALSMLWLPPVMVILFNC